MCSSKSSSDHGRIRTETKSSWFCMVGPRQAVYMVTAVLVHLVYLVSYYLRWQLYSAVPQFPVFWPSEMTSATFCESSPTVQSRVQSTEYRRPNYLADVQIVSTNCPSQSHLSMTHFRPFYNAYRSKLHVHMQHLFHSAPPTVQCLLAETRYVDTLVWLHTNLSGSRVWSHRWECGWAHTNCNVSGSRVWSHRRECGRVQ